MFGKKELQKQLDESRDAYRRSAEQWKSHYEVAISERERALRVQREEHEKERTELEQQIKTLRSAVLRVEPEKPMRRFLVTYDGGCRAEVEAQEYGASYDDASRYTFSVRERTGNIRLGGAFDDAHLYEESNVRIVAEFRHVSSVVEVPCGEG